MSFCSANFANMFFFNAHQHLGNVAEFRVLIMIIMIIIIIIMIIIIINNNNK